ncbi:MAG: hypothetical protein JW803_03380 [Endomicrobiales bacterium]|nr:hypothetical protein [Endomicrobiales bacterium]
MANNSNNNAHEVHYSLLEDGTFVIENYNLARPFSSFFPGIAGLKGIPMWVFYVNRNQGIASMGIKNKDYSIMEFSPADAAYNAVATQGFRTFIKVKKEKETYLYEPFLAEQYTGSGYDVSQEMQIRPHEVLFKETNRTLNLRTTVRYFTVPNEPIAALVRAVTFENMGKQSLETEIIDGLPRIIPYWMSAEVLKAMSYTAQAWVTVTNVEKACAPFYKVKVEINDRPEVTEVRKGNFYFGIMDTGNRRYRTQPVIDPELVFGHDQSYVYPVEFFSNKKYRIPKIQAGDNKYPSAMSYMEMRLAPKKSQTLYSVTGHIESEEKLNAFVKKAQRDSSYFKTKMGENRDIIDDVTEPIETRSGIREFDLYCKQSYLDNLLRGGMPIVLDTEKGKLVFYVFSRKHGDMERDYNFFQLAPSYYSQGNGNYRDMNQNKRNDVFFTPEVEDYNLLFFYNLVQLDGYNPLLVKGASFILDAKNMKSRALLRKYLKPADVTKAENFFSKKYEPGSLLLFLEQNGIRLKGCKAEEFLLAALSVSEWFNDSDHGEGFWVDHWTYNLDLLKSYLAVYPERLGEILFEKKELVFFDNTHVVVPRAEKHVNANGKIRQFDSVVLNTGKSKMLRARTHNPHFVRTKKGHGSIYKTNLITKMLCIALNKISTLDPEGIGVEMEAEKPGWYDALNGLPGVFGSSVCETLELKRMLLFFERAIKDLKLAGDTKVALPEEIHEFFVSLGLLMRRTERQRPFVYWDKSSALKEKYREKTLYGLSGREKNLSVSELAAFIKHALAKIDRGIDKAKDPKSGLFYTYFSYEAVSYKPTKLTSHRGWPCVKIYKFRKKPLPLFLESSVHYLKTINDKKTALDYHNKVRKSALFDKKLGMYKVNAPLKNESTDIGRCTVFSPGWLENESIWMHMEYKYLLELLKSGLYKVFFSEFSKAGVCFQKPETYGRNILENSSFIASSAFPDPRIHGKGFVARLSGSTAELIEIWIAMTSGLGPFSISENGELVFKLKPAIPREYFDKNNMFLFNFLGKTLVCYHNPAKKDLFDGNYQVSKIDVHWFNGKKDTVFAGSVSGDMAESIRKRQAERIDVFIA